MWRASLMTNRLASVADRQNCQRGTPKRRAISSPTHDESSVGSMNVLPRPAASATAATAAGGAWPVMAPVSPRHKSRYSMPSTSVNLDPAASTTNTGYAPGHLVIQFIGTPPSRFPPASCHNSNERGCRSRNVFCSRSISAVSRSRSMEFTAKSPPGCSPALWVKTRLTSTDGARASGHLSLRDDNGARRRLRSRRRGRSPTKHQWGTTGSATP